MKGKLFLLLALLTLLFLNACGSKKNDELKDLNIIRYQLEGNPPELDPNLSTDAISGIITGAIFEGLTRLNETNEAIPGVAERWENDGLTWTFYLRKDAKWHNGDPVLADDFVNAWERVLNPNSAAPYAYIMYSIKNAKEYNEELIKDFSQVGIKKIDEHTIEVELNEPVAYFPSLVSFYTFYPQNSSFYDKHQDNYGTSDRALVGNGPFELKTWSFESRVILEKSDKYWNKDEIKIDRIDMPIILDRTTAYNVYKNDEIDIVVMPDEFVDNYRDSEELVAYEDASVWYLMLNQELEWLQNKKIRQAISYAINREDLVNKVKNGSGNVATSFVPNSIHGYENFFREEYPQANYFEAYNPEKAKSLFEEGLRELNMTRADIGNVSLLVTSNDVGIREGQFYQEQLNKNLGLQIQLEPVTFQIRLQRSQRRDFQMILAGWGPDYDDPMTFLDMWMSTSSYSQEIGFANEEYDKLILAAKASNDNKFRMDTMAKAEALLMEEMPIVPTFFRKKFTLVKPHVKGVVRRALSPDPDFYYAEIIK